MDKLPIDYQLGEEVFKTDLYIENYIVRMEIYKPKGKLRRPTLTTINRILRSLSTVQIIPKSEVDHNPT